MSQVEKKIDQNRLKTFSKVIETEKVSLYRLLEKWGVGAKIYRVSQIDQQFSRIETYAGKSLKKLKHSHLPKDWLS